VFLSVDHSAPIPIKNGNALFLSVKACMTVIVKHLPEIGFGERYEEWLMADVICVEGGARNPYVPPLFQVADVDSGVIRWVNVDMVTHIV
jgi:hypothetical protein